ncbi:hypothetical protein [Microvirga tunisiensis]|uniref:Uncharacterized protein n=1 Tax=Microvirga tunisiensis TaxID=2108360 RepID=A0A5N7MNY3_9HYPH|nr:hypothetical protein [Microvirga tunisiensis]MPR10154.1 hypothetical protein [Microvirga tunisiensis]MPR28360.1 hypothetical protein [Microvirga tunisiensis]
MSMQISLTEMLDIATRNNLSNFSSYTAIIENTGRLLTADLQAHNVSGFEPGDVDSMLEAAQDAKLPSFEHHVVVVEGAANILAATIAEALGVVQTGATFQAGFGGTCAAFWPKTAKQPCPPVLRECDPSGDWVRSKEMIQRSEHNRKRYRHY